jgi:hypothetical protein
MEHFWCMDEPWANTDSQDSRQPKLGGSHHLPPYSILWAWPWVQHPNVILSRRSQVGVPKFPKLRFLQLWRPITFRVDLWFKCNLKQSCNPCWELFNNMLHAAWTQGNWGDFLLLMVKSQIANLIPSPFFGRNLCFKCLNGSCGPIFLDI